MANHPVKVKGGRTFDQELIDKLSVEAERGYDLSKAQRVFIREGRPVRGPEVGESPRVASRVPRAIYLAAKRRAARDGMTVSEFLPGQLLMCEACAESSSRIVVVVRSYTTNFAIESRIVEDFRRSGSRSSDRLTPRADLKLARPLDSLDSGILSLLRENGRMTNQEVANRLGVSEGTVRKRVRDLTATGVMRVVAITDTRYLGLDINITLAIQVEPGRLMDVVDAITAMDEIRYLGITTGSSDLLAAALFRTNDELLDFLATKLGSVPGIRKIDITHVLRVAKRTYDWIMPR